MASSLPPKPASDPLRDPAARDNAATHSFDPDASPQEKGASAGQARRSLNSKSSSKREPDVGREISFDTGADGVVPTITIDDVDKVHVEEFSSPAAAAAAAAAREPPGAMPAAAAPAIPGWFKTRVGWRQFTDIDDSPEGPDAREVRMMNAFIDEQYYGEWYHNAALIVFAVVASHFITRFHFGWGWLFVLLSVCSTYYMTSMARVRRRARDDIQRELTKTALGHEDESVEWMNEFLDRFWLIYEPVLSATIVSSVDQILSTNTPAFLDSLRLTSFTLGTKAPRIDKVRALPQAESDTVVMDWGVSFTPNDVSDLTPREQARKVNPKVVLAIKVGKAGVVVSLPVLVEDITFAGVMRVRLRLVSNFPHVQTVDVSFLEKPVIDYVLKPLGGETFGFDIANIPGLSSFIRDMTHSILGPMMYAPNVFTLNLEQLLSGAPLDSAIGVLKVTVRHARAIKGSKIGGGTPDPFVSISINNTRELARTKYKSDTTNPTWNEVKYVLVNSLSDNLLLTVLDYNDHRRNTELGAALFELGQLSEDASREDVALPILKDGKDRGELHLDLEFFPVLQPSVDESGVEETPESSVGIARFVVHQAKDLDTSKVHSPDVNAYAKVFVGGAQQPVNKSLVAKHTLQPVWECATEYLCADRASSVVTVKIVDDRDFIKDPVIGYLSVRLDDLLAAKKDANSRDWWPLSGAKSGRLRLSADWKPLDMPGALHGAGQYVPPIGVVRLWLRKATDVKNVEAALGGKSDPYVRVMMNGTVQARTEVVNNNLNPEWDQIIYTPVHSARERLLLEVMDYQHLTKDRSLGTVEVNVKDLVEESPEDEVARNPLFAYRSTGRREEAAPIRLDKGHAFKGQLHYAAEFVPAWAVKGVKFDVTGAGDKLGTTAGAEPGGGGNPSAGTDDDEGGTAESSSLSSSDVESMPGVTVSKPLYDKAPLSPTSPGFGEGGEGAGQVNGKTHKPSKSTDTTRTFDTVKTDATGATGKTGATRETSPGSRNGKAAKEETGVEVPKDELLAQQSGVMVIHVTHGELARKARLEVLLDDAYWPAFSTPRAHSTKLSWLFVGEAFVKELDFGRVWMRLNAGDEGEKDEVIAEWKGDTKAFLQRAMDGPVKFSLEDEGGRVAGTVEVEARYVPVPVHLEPRESINNMGVLKVALLDGDGIRGVDRGGKSDPYCVFALNGQKVFKSQTKKKTVKPVWNEEFVVSVPSRVGSQFELEVYDWNQIEQAKLLGSSRIDLEDLEPFHGVERTVSLSHAKHAEAGTVRISLLFQPEIIMRTRKNTSTFSTAGRAMTQIGAAPLSVGKGVFHGVTGIFKHGHHSDSSEEDLPRTNTATTTKPGEPGPVPDLPGAQMSQPVSTGEHLGAPSAGLSSPNGAAMPPSEPGTLRITVLEAKDIYSGPDSVKPYVAVRVGDKEFKTKHAGKTVAPEWNETFEVSAGAGTLRLAAEIYDHHTLGKDKLLGEAEVDIWKHIQPTDQSAADVLVEMRGEGQGLLKLRLAFFTEPMAGSGRKSFSSSGGERSRFSSPSKFSVGRKSMAADRKGRSEDSDSR